MSVQQYPDILESCRPWNSKTREGPFRGLPWKLLPGGTALSFQMKRMQRLTLFILETSISIGWESAPGPEGEPGSFRIWETYLVPAHTACWPHLPFGLGEESKLCPALVPWPEQQPRTQTTGPNPCSSLSVVMLR